MLCLLSVSSPQTKKLEESLHTAIGASDWPGARSSLEKLLELHPTSSSLHYTLGSVLRNMLRSSNSLRPKQRNKIHQQAAQEYERCLDLEPEHSEAYFHWADHASDMLGLKLRRKGVTPERIIGAYTHAAAVAPDHTEVYRKLAAHLDRSGQGTPGAAEAWQVGDPQELRWLPGLNTGRMCQGVALINPGDGHVITPEVIT